MFVSVRFRRVVVFMFICLCIFGSTKSRNALAAFPSFDVANSTVIKEVDSSFAGEKGQVIDPIVPPQPRNKRGELVCTSDRYIQDEQQIGEVSWYGGDFHGRQTASGEVFDKNANTLAHLTLPMGTDVIVENRETGVKVKAKVNDCGPYIKGRIADVSYGLAKKLGIVEAGHATVIITVL